jgi:hypothetical protein
MRLGPPFRPVRGYSAFLSLSMLAALSGCPGTGGTIGGNTSTGGNTGGNDGGTQAETIIPGAPQDPTDATGIFNGTAVVLGYNELGMHCMNQDFSELMLLPPSNNLRAQVIVRGGEHPQVVSGADFKVTYTIPDNTHSADKTNFWTYAPALFGVTLPSDIGLTGNGLSGQMKPTGENDWVATSIPVTPMLDSGELNAYPLATITVMQGAQAYAATKAVVPVSWEIHCDLCHTQAGISVATHILRAHDRLHGTTLESSKPVACAGCHADPALGKSGTPGVSTLSSAMHKGHATRMGPASALSTECYACHPGQQTQCLRDVHFSKGMLCKDCHTSMQAVGDPARRPWQDEPRCDGCHHRAGSQYEQAGTLYRMSKGHGNVHCAACHGPPHAITPTVVPADNLQAIALQGHAGMIDTCTVCHTSQPEDAFWHHAGAD